MVSFIFPIATLLVVMTTSSSADPIESSCNLPQSVSPAIPKPTLFTPTSYQARVELTFQEKNSTVVADEYLDYAGNRGAILVYLDDGTKAQFVYSYNTSEVFRINDDRTCLVKNMSTDFTSELLGPVFMSGDADKRHIFGSVAALLYLGNSSNTAFVNTQTTVRGISANAWTACISTSFTPGGMRTTYYYSQPGWNTSYSSQPTLLRIEVEGMYLPTPFGAPGTTLPPSSARHFHNTYEVINYLPYVDQTSPIFETPLDVICEGRTSVRPLPQLATTFRYRADIVDPASSLITHYAVWYSEEAKIVREDTRQAHPDPEAGTSKTVTEIHDFNTGIRYVVNHDGDCGVFPIDANAADSKQDMNRFQYNQSIIINIRDPNSFFRFNYNYKYIGQRTVRGITCDVYSAVIPNYVVDTNQVNATFEYYFLAQDWNDLPLAGLEAVEKGYPIQLVISAPLVYYTRIYNFFDFAESFILVDAFDISQCVQQGYPILSFRLTFPGEYNPASLAEWKHDVYFKLAEVMEVNPLRLNKITLDSDKDNVYVSCWLVGTANYAQFQMVTSATPILEHQDDRVIYHIYSQMDCADACINIEDFQCNSFEYCLYHDSACRLLSTHVVGQNNPIIPNATACEFHTRPIPGPSVKETKVGAAYGNLENAIRDQQLFVTIPQLNGDNHLYTAINVEVLTGQPFPTKDLPSIPVQFSYRLETVNTLLGRVVETYVWYDGINDIVRYDSRDPNSDSPYMTTYIHDFKKGVGYQINQVTESCTVSPLSLGGFDIASGQPTKDGSLIVSMNSPQSMFYLNGFYRYDGQKTVRGILCDVYESKRTDFQLAAYNMTQTSIFKYYFQDEHWDYITPDGNDLTQRKPVMLEVEDSSTGTFLTVNFYDFDDEFHSVNIYDTSPCYDPDQQKSFIITFRDQAYHPYLDQAYTSFINNAVTTLATQTKLSPIQFQKVSVSYDDSNVYLWVTALGSVPAIDLFTPVMKVALNTSAPLIAAGEPAACAAACIANTNMVCNSFDWCQFGSSPACLFGDKHSESEGDPLTSTNTNYPCTHYSRTENGTYQTVDVQTMYEIITDYVYDDLFKITVTLSDNTNKTYLATSIRDDVTMSTDPNSTPGSLLRQFVVLPNNKFSDNLINVSHSMLSVTECAVSCVQENTFICQSFDYSYSTGLCRLTTLHPDWDDNVEVSIVNQSMYTNIYTKYYTGEYQIYPEEVFTSVADKTLPLVHSDELCARQCTRNPDFVCESFEFCEDGTCYLRKTHMIQVKPSDVKNATGCTHYSRQHLFDYIERDYKTIQVPVTPVAEVSSPRDCANLCALGERLPSCASFTLCGDGIDRQCALTTADPTVSSDVQIISNEHCTLYTRANPLPFINPSGGATTVPTLRTSTSTSTITRSSSTTTTTSQSSTIKSSPQNNISGVSATTTQQANGKACKGASSGNSSVTGPRVGIAIGTLILGLIVGGLCSFLFMRFRQNADPEDAQMLKTWGN